MFRLLIVVAALVIVAGCVPQEKMLWVRTDGQPAKDNPVLAQQYQVDSTVCLGETQKANMAGTTYYGGGIVNAALVNAERSKEATDVAKGCMAQRGYMLVPEKQADAYAAQARAIAATRDTPKTAKQ